MTITNDDILKQAIKDHGENSFVVQQIRNQIAAEKTGKSAEEIFISGAAPKPKRENG